MKKVLLFISLLLVFVFTVSAYAKETNYTKLESETLEINKNEVSQIDEKINEFVKKCDIDIDYEIENYDEEYPEFINLKFKDKTIHKIKIKYVGEIQTEENKEETFANSAEARASVLYRSHIESIGWEKDFKNDGAFSGTTHQSKRLEAIEIKVESNINGGIEYRTHIQEYGWEKDFKKDGAQSGTSHESKRLEAIEIKLYGNLSEIYDVYYRVHAENYGWLGWAKNGEKAGTAGFALRLEGIEIKLVKKDSTISEYGTKKAFICKEILYSTHVSNLGWQGYSYDGNTSGTTGQSKRLEGIKIKLSNQKYTGNIEYKTFIESLGWESSYKKNDEISGTTGRSLRLEAIKIRLTGDMATYYDVYYRVHAENYGWLGWTKNDEIAGTVGYGYRLEAIQIQLVKKGEASPGSTANPNHLRYIRYRSYQSSWKAYTFDGEQNGSTSNSLEAISISLTNALYPGNITYSSYKTGAGWQNAVSNGTQSNGIGNKIEAIKINITGEIATYYDVYYSVYVSSIGWTGWAKNNNPCGNIGNEKYITSFKVKLVKKGENPGSTNNTYVEAPMSIKYTTNVNGKGWQNYVSDGATSGTTGQSTPINGIKIKVNKKIPAGSVQYNTHVSNVGWQTYYTDNAQSGKQNKVEAIKIRLTGELANTYDIYYRVHTAEVGWMGWTSNDRPAGTIAGGLGVEAIDIKLVAKGGPAPENTNNAKTTEPYLEAHWETGSDGHVYFYDVFGNMVKGRGYTMGSTTHYFGPTGIYLGTKNLQILDISAHNGVIDWNSVAHSDVYGVILRVAASAQYRDSRLKENVAGCKKYGIPYGIYIYSYAENYTEGQAYANFTNALINEFSMNPTLGIFLDLESNNYTQFMGPIHYEAVVKGFYSVIPNAELYTYTNYADTALNSAYLRNRITWIADYRGYVGYTGSYRMWQYTSKGSCPGVSGNVDRSILYRF